MARDSEATRRRIFEAAFEEFARHGIAGARIDRIAAAACANKQLIYAYFGSKQALFDEVVAIQVARFHREVEFDPERLPEFAGAAFDFFADNPELVRLGSWHTLEAPDGSDRIEAIEHSIAERTRALAEAQGAGRLDRTFEPEELLSLVFALASSWASATPEFRHTPAEEQASRAGRRRGVIEATRRLVGPVRD
jgi:AcrR family transcriptional regulator